MQFRLQNILFARKQPQISWASVPIVTYIAHRDVQFTASLSKMEVKTRTFMQSATRLNML